MPSYPKTLHAAYVALGSNIGAELLNRRLDPKETLRAGLAALVRRLGEKAGGVLVAASGLYETEPVGYLDQPAFANAVALVKSSLGPEALLKEMLAVEREFGRVRGLPNGPRTLDLDLLMVDDLVLSTTTVTLPHPRMAGRRFVLEPLAEIAPGLRHPVLGRPVEELLRELPDAGVRRLEERVG